MLTRAAILAVCLSLAQAATNADDVQAIQSLQACVQANAAGKGFLMGWGVESAGAASDAGVTAAIRQTNEQLAALGVPGVTAGTGLSTPGGSSNNDPCGNPVPWTGLLCSGDRITQVLMSQLGPDSLPCDVGTLGSLSALSAAQNLDFTAVGLAGTLPAAWGSGFGSLEKLVLSQNNISGPLPEQWSSGFPRLNTLDLNQNTITGPLPGNWSAGFPSLLNLVLGHNGLTGPLPSWTGGFRLAQLFGLSSNAFSGSLPSEWSFPELRTLELYSNGFSGCLPARWPTGLPQLESLSVQGNSLAGNIPTSFGSWDSLTTIQITPGNNLCGTISATLARTPDGSGERFKIPPPGRQGDGSYLLPACSGAAGCVSVPDDLTRPAAGFRPLTDGPAPAPGPFAEAPETAQPGIASPSKR